MSQFLWNALDENWDITAEYWWVDIGPIVDGCVWSTVGSTWDVTECWWFQELAPEIEAVTGGSPDEGIREFEKLDKRKRRKVLRLIMHLNGTEFSQQREVRDDLTVTTKDIITLLKEYNEYKKQTDIFVTVSNVKVE